MDNQIELGIGFVTGRPNVCNIVNKYYKKIIKQTEKYPQKIHTTIFIIYDVSYQQTPEEEFYKIAPEVLEKIDIKYITPKKIEEEQKILIKKYNLSKEEVSYILGHGHARGRNTLMYYALKEKMDYLIFWDDDEYPVACLKDENGKVIWKEQDNIIKHLTSIQDAEISIGYHCGYISPIPYVELNQEIEENIFKKYIEAISNDIIDWENIKEIMTKNNGVTYAKQSIAEGKGEYEILGDEKGIKWVAGSTLCINLKKIKNIPAFYNPPDARGEDTFFSILLKDCKVIKTPVYHFHDGFLKYKSIMNENYPNKLRKIEPKDENVGSRFLKASLGWIKYKPLLLYINNKENYHEEMKQMEEYLKISLPKIQKIFPDEKFEPILHLLKEYDQGVEKHYKQFIETNKVWDKIKNNI